MRQICHAQGVDKVMFVKNLVLALLGSVVVSSAGLAVADVVPPGTEAEIRERTAPVGEVCRAGEICGGATEAPAATDTAAGAGMSGEQIYNTFCFACHATGVSGSPLLGDAAAWEPRLAKGMDVMLANTVNGFNVMPPKGTCIACSEAELQAAIDHMIAGGD